MLFVRDAPLCLLREQFQITPQRDDSQEDTACVVLLRPRPAACLGLGRHVVLLLLVVALDLWMCMYSVV